MEIKINDLFCISLGLHYLCKKNMSMDEKTIKKDLVTTSNDIIQNHDPEYVRLVSPIDVEPLF